MVPKGYRLALTVRGRDYVYPGGSGGKLSNMKNEFTGVGPFVHDDPRDRPVAVLAAGLDTSAAGARTLCCCRSFRRRRRRRRRQSAANRLRGGGAAGKGGRAVDRHCEPKAKFHGEWIAAKSRSRLRLPNPLNLKDDRCWADRIADTEPTAIRTHLGAIFVSLELSRSTWLITSLSPGNGEKMSKHGVAAGDLGALLAKFAELQRKALARTGKNYPIITIQEAGLDGFSLHRVLQQEGIESHVVDAAWLRCRAGGGGRRLTRSTVRRCCGCCWPTSGANRGCARWW